jgi:predicted DNA-binding transcriptional regulator YafY
MRSIADEILGLLADGSSWSGLALSARLGVSLRTARRALAKLREEGVALDTEVGRGGGVRIVRGAGLPRVRLSQQEAIELLLALAIAESLALPLMGANLQPLRSKLAAAFPIDERASMGELRKRILIGAAASPKVASSWHAPGKSTTRHLQDAFTIRKVVRFAYQDERGTRSRRTVEAQYLLLNHPAWYLLGFDLDRRAGRVFRMDRIDRVDVAAERFTVRPASSLMEDVDRWFVHL